MAPVTAVRWLKSEVNIAGTDEAGLSLIFDVYKGEDGSHVRRVYDY